MALDNDCPRVVQLCLCSARWCDAPGPEATTAAHPSIVQAKDGTLHASCTFTLKEKKAQAAGDGKKGECIKHARFHEAWIKAPQK